MPHIIAHTPESILPRCDSRNPATTCRGITANGRPCRRALAGSGSGSGSTSASASAPSQAMLTAALKARKHLMRRDDLADLYCWQHKGQVETLIARLERKVERSGSYGRSINSATRSLNPRSSIDTLMERLGVLDIGTTTSTPTGGGGRVDHEKSRQPVQRDTTTRLAGRNRQQQQQRRIAPTRTFCCFEIVDEDEDELPPATPIRKPAQRHHTAESVASSEKHIAYASSAAMDTQRRPAPTQPAPPRSHSRGQTRLERGATHPSPSPQLQQTHYQFRFPWQWVPANLSPQSTSLLFAELAKPISAADEHGYIYMFWVTPSPARPPADIASSLLPTPADSSTTGRRPDHRIAGGTRSVSDALRAAQELNMFTSPTTTLSSSSSSLREEDSRNGYRSHSSPARFPLLPPKPQRTLRLKIGRTSNVHRRLNEWTRQCSYNLTLIRYYPYVSAKEEEEEEEEEKEESATATMSPGWRSNKDQRKPPPPSLPHRQLMPGRTVPHVHRVERLIHIELRDMKARDLGACEECGKEHREWFEIAADKEALRRVDECVRRWVAWGERHG